MKKEFSKIIALLLASIIMFSSCVSTTMIQTSPSGAKVYLDGESVGTTPYTHSDTKVVGSTTTVLIKKEGYEDFVTSISRNEEVDVGAVVGGIFFLFPFFWTMKYKPIHNYELVIKKE
jgi:hypothetical protein